MGSCWSAPSASSIEVADGGGDGGREGVVARMEIRQMSRDAQESVVTRMEIRQMSRDAQDRFARAVLQMMRNTDGPQSSQFFRLAGYHGWPDNHCHHGQETFPGWHRAYLLDFERTMQRADRELGEDGRIGLPYWDWMIDSINGETWPNVFERHFSRMPADLINTESELSQRGYSELHPEDRILERLRSAQLPDQVEMMLLQEEHFLAASTRLRRGNSLESPHDTVHVALGFPMTSVSFAAFHPVFFLHHCQVDRLYEKYLQIEPDSQVEMANFQERLQTQRGEPNRYEEPLVPFTNPDTGRLFMVRDTFNSRALGYTYDRLPEDPRPLQKQWPTLAVFYPIEALAVARKSFELHVIVRPATARWTAPAVGTDWKAPEPCTDGYAGWCGVFGGKGKECKNCTYRQTFQVSVDVTNVLAKLGLKRSEANVFVVPLNMEGKVVERPVGIPAPTLRGPFFEAGLDEVLKKGASGADVLALQQYLKNYKYYLGKLDAKLGSKTREAIRKFQIFHGLKADGVAGPETKAYITKPRVERHAHGDGDRHKAVFSRGQEIKVFVDVCPGYLPASRVEGEVQTACDAWQRAASSNISFKLVLERRQSDLEISWGDDHDEDNDFLFDGKGGNLARTEQGRISLDAAEHWVLQGDPPNPRKVSPFELLPVLLHEMGHVLGLAHSKIPEDVMFPYYVPGKVAIAPGDVVAIGALYS